MVNFTHTKVKNIVADHFLQEKPGFGKIKMFDKTFDKGKRCINNI